MGSLNSAAISVVSKDNKTIRNQGGSIVTTRLNDAQTGPTSSKTSTTFNPDVVFRSEAELGTQPDENIAQRSTVRLGGLEKIATSDDASLSHGLINRFIGGVAPDENNQPEIGLKGVSQNSSYHTGNRIVVRNSDDDGLISREDNASVRPPGE